MRNTYSERLLVWAVLALMPIAMSAQAPVQGVPDLSGVYLVRNFNGNIAMMSPELKGQGSPFRAEEAQRYKEFQVLRETLTPEEDPSPSARCLPPGLTFLMTIPYAVEIIQTPTKVLTFHEFGNFVRQIRLNVRDHGDPTPSWLGHSIGHYEGDTLVVDTIGFNGKGWLDNRGLRASEQLHTVERFRKVNGELHYSVTINDPTLFTRAWTVVAYLVPQPGVEIEEFVCLDNNKLIGSPGQKVQAR